MRNRILLILFISILIIPISIQAQTENTSEDPLYLDQWALHKIGFESAGIGLLKTENMMIGKKVNTPDSEFFYEEGNSFSANKFTVQLDSTPIRRLSIELANPQGKWTVEVRDSDHQLLIQNTSTYKRIDVLLPKRRHFSTLSISIVKREGEWSENPIISKLTGVNSSLIAVVDSGVIEHEDFCDNILYSLGKDYREGMELPFDTYGHGTHVTGIIAACNQNGIGTTGAIGGAEVDVIPLKVLGANGLTDDNALAAAVQAAIDYDVDVINLSIAGKGSTEMFENKIRDALLAGIPVVAAAGNGSELTEDVYPGNFPGVITVAGVDSFGNKSRRSNFGWEVDVSAPGIDILSTYLEPSYTKLTGTSMAAPYVTSVIAYYKWLNPELDFVQINRLLVNSAKDIGAKGYDIYTGAGLVQFSNSIEVIENIDWLNVKNEQPIENKSKIILGFSRELVGKTLLLFKDEKIFKQLTIEKMVEEISIDHSKFVLRDNPLSAVVVDNSGKVLDFSRISLINSGIVTNSGKFLDVPTNHWAYEEIMQASEAKLVNGYPNGSFKPSQYITRRQSIMMIERLFRMEENRSLLSERMNAMSIPFKDVTLSTSGILAILSGAELGYIKGVNGYFYPEKQLTRGQMALILARALSPDMTSVSTNIPFRDVPKNAEYYEAVQLLAEKGIITKQNYFRPNETITRAQFAAMLNRTKQTLH